jgi:hypothetical protein
LIGIDVQLGKLFNIPAAFDLKNDFAKAQYPVVLRGQSKDQEADNLLKSLRKVIGCDPLSCEGIPFARLDRTIRIENLQAIDR